ncbi:hypothetical protein [Micromonospora sp. LOL_021]|uniref:hypothetical protein n=1 Tax=Micromonospora sp. LOL_021 TaxID=3345417 RepID=UPI003A846A01
MFATNLMERRHKPQRVTDQAWAQLVSAVDSAGDAARLARRHTSNLATDTGARMGPASAEARHRARAAVDALAGRRRAMPWAWLAGAAAAGVALGWLAGAMTRSVLRPGEPSDEARIEFVDVDEPTGSTPRR